MASFVRYANFTAVVLSIALAGCGGGESSGGSVAVAPTPSPSPSPTPSPSPSPSPTPSSSASVTANLAGAVNGSALTLQRACSSAKLQYVNGQISDILDITPITLPAATNVQFFSGQDRIVGLGDTFYRGATGTLFTPFGSLSDFTMLIANKSGAATPSSTFGFTDRTTPCFFAAGLPAAPSAALSTNYEGRVDGLNQFDAFVQRLYSSNATAVMDLATRTGKLTLELFAYSQAFGDFTKLQRNRLLPITADLTVSGTQVTGSNLTGWSGYSGTLTGHLVGVRGMALAFEMHSGSDVVWGAIALDDPSCSGCWDY